MNWTPQSTWESAPPTIGQLDFMRKQGIDVSQVKYKGLASKIIGRLVSRINLGLATGDQLSLMHKLGLDEQTCARLTIREASLVIDKRIAAKKAERAALRDAGEQLLDVGPVDAG